MRSHDYRQTLIEGVSVWKNHLMSIEAMRDPLVNKNSLNSMIELLKILPTRDYEFFDLGDYLGYLTQIMNSHEKMI